MNGLEEARKAKMFHDFDRIGFELRCRDAEVMVLAGEDFQGIDDAVDQDVLEFPDIRITLAVEPQCLVIQRLVVAGQQFRKCDLQRRADV